MNDGTAHSVHWSFWLIGAVALIWNLMGVMNFFMQMDADSLASFPESHRAIIEGRPAWATAGFATAVFGGTLGCLLLLLRKSAAYYVFIASLLGAIVQMPPWLSIASATIGLGAFLVVAGFLIWYSKWAGGKGWIS
jgi:hypothetical protein